MKRIWLRLLLIAVLVCAAMPAAAAPASKQININVLLNTPVTEAILKDLGTHGKVGDVMYKLNALTMRAESTELTVIQKLPYVAAAGPDQERKGSPIDMVSVSDFAGGLGTWNLDAINVTQGNHREVVQDGTGVYVAVLDTGLHDSWRQYFPEERIAVEYAKAFRGGGADMGKVSEPTNMWEHDQNGHGTHVTSTILGFRHPAGLITGVAPKVKIIPVKVLGQNGSGWSSVVAQGVVYVAELKKGPLADKPVVINMSLGGSVLDPVEKAAVDYATDAGVIIVAAAGNEGTAGMGYPGAYAPVISVAASGWVGEWKPVPQQPGFNRTWWLEGDVAESTGAEDFYMTDFSSRDTRPDDDLDVAAPGSWIVGPYQTNSGQLNWYFMGGTSMASPHVAGIVALMAQKSPNLTPNQAEEILEASAVPMPPGCRMVVDPSTPSYPNPWEYCWAADATGHGFITADRALMNTPQP